MRHEEAKAARPIAISVAVLPFVVTITGLLAVILFFKSVPLYLALVLGWAVAVLIAFLCGQNVRQVVTGTYQGMKSTFFVVGILLMIAGVISSWLMSGTVPGLISFGIQLIQPEFLVVLAFVLTAVTSMALGSSVGTLSTMGAAIAGMAAVYGISPALIGGALVCGAMVGDRTSPVSGAFHLVAGMTGTKAEDNYRPMWSTGLPMIGVCLILFAWLGFGKAQGTLDPMSSPMLQELASHFHLPWYIMLPPALVLLLAVLRVKILRNLGIGILFGTLLAMFVQGDSFVSVLKAIWLGYTLDVDGHTVLHGGGIWPMFNQVLLILAAGALNGMMEATGMMHVIVQVLLDRIRSATGLIVTTVCLSIVIALLACNQSLSIIVPSRTLRDTYAQMGLPSRYLVRSVADSGVVVSPLIPWNLHGILCSTAIGISTWTYFPYAFSLWGLPLLTLVLATRIKNKKNSDKLDKLLQF